METIVQSFTTNLKRVLSQAAQLAVAENKHSIDPTHLFYGLVNQAETSITSLQDLKKQLKVKQSRPVKHIATPTLSEPSRKILLDATTLAQSYNHTYVGAEHLLVTLLESKNQKMRSLLCELELDNSKLNTHLRTLMKSSSKLFEALDSILTAEHAEDCDGHHDEGGHQEEKKQAGQKRRASALEYFATLITHPDVARTLDPCIGRGKEIDRLTQILARRTKNNPVLVGPPGVGKTAIVEGLAKKIAAGEVPEFLKDKKIYSLNLTSLVAGSAFRGELEIRLQHVINEIKADPTAILFIDEIHNLVGAGSSNGSLDAGNILKPALARGELRCIGATTFTEYKRYIEEDAALERRFQSIIVNPPTIAEATEILHGLIPSYEEYHRIKISPEAIKAAVELSSRYITEKNLPDKAIDVLDEAAAKLKLDTHATQKQQFSAASDQIEKLVKDETPPTTTIKELLSSLQTTLLTAQGEHTATLRQHHVASIIADTTGIPLVKILEDQQEKLLALEEQLSKHIVGQEHAKQTVAHFIRRARAGLLKAGRPIASFLFLGPSGVGKTELAKTLAQEVFGEGGFVKLDMSEFSESFTISRLIGAPSGYVGYKEGGRLTESVRQRPFSLVLFDEIEKAHPRVLQLLLQILEDGCLSDAAGKRADFSNTIIVLTSNIGAKFFSQNGMIGFDSSENRQGLADREAVLGELKNVLNPELINRIDQKIVFHALDRTHLTQIISLHLADLQARLAKQEVRLSWSDDIIETLADRLMTTTSGAREVRHTIENELENVIANHLLASVGSVDRRVLHLEKKHGTIQVVPIYEQSQPRKRSIQRISQKTRASSSKSRRA